MPQNNIVQFGPSPTDLDPSVYSPAVVVWPGIAETLGMRAHGSVPEPIRYPGRDRQMILTTLGKDKVTVTYIDPRKSDKLSKGKVLSKHTHDRDSVVEFWPQGSPGPRIPITQYSCVYLQDGESRMFEGDDSMKGPYPSRPPLSIPPPLIQPPTYPSNASQEALQHRFGDGFPPPIHLSGAYPAVVPTVDPACLSLEAHFGSGDSAYHQSPSRRGYDADGSRINNQRANDHSSHSQIIYSHIDKSNSAYNQSTDGQFVCSGSFNDPTANGEFTYDPFSHAVDHRPEEGKGSINEGPDFRSFPEPGVLSDW